MRADGIERGVGIVMAPHWSGMSVETYVERVEQAAGDHGATPAFTFVRSYHDHPRSSRSWPLGSPRRSARFPDEVREGAAVIFSAHSLPVRTVDDGSLRCKYCDCDDSCRYRDGLQETADLVAGAPRARRTYLIAWQSAGRTADPWWGPPVEDVIRELAMQGHTAAVCLQRRVRGRPPRGAVRPRHRGAGRSPRRPASHFARTRMPNADPAYLDVLAQVVRDHLARGRRTAREHELDAPAGRRRRRRRHRPHRRRTGCTERRPLDRRHRVSRPGGSPGGKLRSVDGRRPAAPGRRRLVPRAQAVGGRRCAGSSASSSETPPARPGRTCGPIAVSCRLLEGRAVRHPRRRRRPVPMARGSPRAGQPSRRAGSADPQARRTTATNRSARCCDGGSATRRPTSRSRRCSPGSTPATSTGSSVRATFPELVRGSVAGEPDPRRAGGATPGSPRRSPGRCSCGRAAGSSGSPTCSPARSATGVRHGRARRHRSSPDGWRSRHGGRSRPTRSWSRPPAHEAARLLGGAAPARRSGARGDPVRLDRRRPAGLSARARATGLPDGTGFVVPRGKAPMTAARGSSSKWPSEAFGTRARSCGATSERVGEETSSRRTTTTSCEACARHLAAVVPCPTRPSTRAVVRWPARCRSTSSGTSSASRGSGGRCPAGIVVVGQAYDGVGVPDCVRAAGETAERGARLAPTRTTEPRRPSS